MSVENEGLIGPTIDSLYALRQRRLELERKTKAMKEQEVALRERIVEMLYGLGLTSARGGVATASVTVKEVPVVEDWDAFYQHVKQTDGWDLFQNRISVTGWRARVEEGVVVPGISVVEDVDISLTKASRG
jgi:hypothetical protein